MWLRRTLSSPLFTLLVRHGESLGNLDEATYTRIPDWKIPLTERGVQESISAGLQISRLLEHPDANAFIYVSPYMRARATLDEVLKLVDPAKVVSVREEPRISEQQFGNLQSVARMREAKLRRNEFGRFYYRFDDGESALDVYSRVSSFIATVYRDIDTLERRGVLTPETNIVIISHGLSARTFLMRWFQLSVQMFEQLSNQPNGTLLVMERRENAKGEQWYELTQKSWQLLNLKGTIDSDRVLAHGTGFGSRKLVSSSDSDSLDERLRRRLDDIPIDG